MRVLITGGGGFLAGHLSSYLQGAVDGVEVRDLSRADCDLSKDREQLATLVRGFKPETTFHLAGRINGLESELDRDNRVATMNLLDAVRSQYPASRVVFGSTTAVYAEDGTAAVPLVESNVADPRGPYATSKNVCEQAVRSYGQSGGWIVIARMSNPVGSNMSSGLLCGTLARQIVEVERGRASAITLRHLNPKRDFISVGDCVRALWRLGEFAESGSTYNVASGVSMSVSEIVDLYLGCARVRPIEVRTAGVENERSTVQEQWVSNEKLRALGWEAQETLTEAIRDQLDVERARA